jgi:cell division protein FtsB
MAKRPPARPRRRAPRSSILLRRLAVVGLVLIAFLYYRPLRTYLHTRDTLAGRRAQVRGLEAQRRQLQRQVTASTGTAALVLEARRLALVKPGERLFIVKGIGAWLRAHRTIGGDG